MDQQPRFDEWAEVTGALSYSGVTAEVPLTGQVDGSAILAASVADSRRIVSLMLGDNTTDDDQLADGFGELANMIAGSLKVHLSQEGRALKIGLPRTRLPVSAGGNDVRIGLRTSAATTWYCQMFLVQGFMLRCSCCALEVG
ncbi:MAG: chemotaxis protein CheX [Nannocystaceae bacterium]